MGRSSMNERLIDTKAKVIEEEKKENEPKKRKRGRPRKSETHETPGTTGTPGTPGTPGTAEQSNEENIRTLNEQIKSYLLVVDTGLKSAGLSPMNPAQKLLINTGLVGCCLKYGGGVAIPPELSLLIGTGWVAVEKYGEYKKKNPKKENEKPHNNSIGP